VPRTGAFAEDAARTVVSDILVKEGLAATAVKFLARGTCLFELGGGLVARIDADFFGGDKPRMTVEGPSTRLRADRTGFGESRRDRWFEPR
jgi:hypothetical protein